MSQCVTDWRTDWWTAGIARVAIRHVYLQLEDFQRCSITRYVVHLYIQWYKFNKFLIEWLTSVHIHIRRPGQKRRRGRPRTKDRPPKTRLISKITRKKISESAKKFSVCKLCCLQCRGFRGLVDHMHRDHQDYKPWECHICDFRTTFSKTLYRHLKQVHNTRSGICPVCGESFRRAQTMMQHFSKVRSQAVKNASQY